MPSNGLRASTKFVHGDWRNICVFVVCATRLVSFPIHLLLKCTNQWCCWFKVSSFAIVLPTTFTVSGCSNSMTHYSRCIGSDGIGNRVRSRWVFAAMVHIFRLHLLKWSRSEAGIGVCTFNGMRSASLRGYCGVVPEANAAVFLKYRFCNDLTHYV
jgi:hypothetical protein